MRKRHRLILFACAAALLTLALARWLWPQPDPLYTVTILPTPPGMRAFPQAINDHGQVVGRAHRLGARGSNLFLWDEGEGMKVLDPVAGARLDINNHGRITGTMLDPNYAKYAFLREPDGTVRSLGSLGGSSSSAVALNNRGQVVGVSETANGSQHAFLWDRDTGMRDLGTLGGVESKAFAINNSGRVFGRSETGRGLSPAFLWDENEDMSKAGPPHPSANLDGINSAGWLAGDTYVEGEHWMVLWNRDKGMQTLFPIGQAEVAFSYGFADRVLLNDANQVAFSLYDERAFWRLRRRIGGPRQRHFLWDPKLGKIALADYIPAGPLKSFWRQDLNNRGCILGGLVSRDGDYSRSLVMEPISERWAK